jgi:hypothetical protein
VKLPQSPAGNISLQITSWLNNFARKAGPSVDILVFGFASFEPCIFFSLAHGVLGDYVARNKVLSLPTVLLNKYKSCRHPIADVAYWAKCVWR